jgi:crossover junction endodeoxyribonuclease RusA
MITVTLPWPAAKLNPNNPSRHWRAKQGEREDARKQGYWLTTPGAPLAGSLAMTVTFFPPDRRRRDLDNLLAAMKPSLDGICSRLDIDDSQIRQVLLRWGDKDANGKVVVSIGELA